MIYEFEKKPLVEGDPAPVQPVVEDDPLDQEYEEQVDEDVDEDDEEDDQSGEDSED